MKIDVAAGNQCTVRWVYTQTKDEKPRLNSVISTRSHLIIRRLVHGNAETN
jgi:hypothetical protein